MTTPDESRRSGRRQFLLVASLFIVPVVTAILLYFSSDWRPVVNSQGTLIDPPRTLTASGLALPDGQPAPADVFQGRWSIVHPAAACDARTEALFDELGRVRLALDKDAPRVRARPAACRRLRRPGAEPRATRICSCSPATGPDGEALARLRSRLPWTVLPASTSWTRTAI